MTTVYPDFGTSYVVHNKGPGDLKIKSGAAEQRLHPGQLFIAMHAVDLPHAEEAYIHGAEVANLAGERHEYEIEWSGLGGVWIYPAAPEPAMGWDARWAPDRPFLTFIVPPDMPAAARVALRQWLADRITIEEAK